jgi:hypothetical protein
MNKASDIKWLVERLEHSAEDKHDSLGLAIYLGNQDRLYKAIDEMQAEIDRLSKDAERYRFLSVDFGASSGNIDGNHYWAYRRNFSLLGATLDEAIDRATQARGDKT